MTPKFLLHLVLATLIVWQIHPSVFAKTCAEAILEVSSETSVSDDFVRFYKEGYSDGYESSERLENFWGTHRRFGIVKTEDQRILLVAKSEELAKKLVFDMKKAFNSPHEAVLVKPLEQVKDGVTYDITETVSPLVLKLHEEYAYPGANCWNLCLRVSKVDHGLHPTFDGDFRHWLNSPLAEKITSSDQLRVGDIIAWVAHNREANVSHEVHGAVYVAPNLIFSKNGSSGEKPYRLMDIDEVFSMYMSNDPSRIGMSNRFDFYRVTPLKAFMTQHQKIIPQILKSAYETLKERELFLESFFLQDGTVTRMDKISSAQAFRDVSDQLEKQALEQIDKSGSDQSLTENEKEILKSLWQGVIVRLSSLK